MSEIIYRPCTMDDAEAFYELTCAEYLEEHGAVNMTIEEALMGWTDSDFDVEKSTMAAFLPDGTMVGEVEVWDTRALPVRPRVMGYVRPDYRGLGIGRRLTQWGIECSKRVFERVPPDAKVTIQSYSAHEDGCQLLEDLGFIETRQSYLMKIEFNTPPPPPEFPKDFHILTMKDHPVLEDFIRVQMDSFRDHRGFVDEPLEKVTQRWQNFVDNTECFDPELFMLLKDGANDVGVVVAWSESEEDANTAWVDTFGILPAYRRQGLGLKLLQHTFKVFQARGIPKAALSVDGASLTGANRLYEKAGMHIFKVYHAYELQLRDGIEMSNQG